MPVLAIGDTVPTTSTTTVPAASAPRDITFLPGSEKLFLSWKEPETVRPSSLTGYEIGIEPLLGSDPEQFFPVTTNNLIAQDPDGTVQVHAVWVGEGETVNYALTPQTSYDVKIRATARPSEILGTSGVGEWGFPMPEFPFTTERDFDSLQDTVGFGTFATEATWTPPAASNNVDNYQYRFTAPSHQPTPGVWTDIPGADANTSKHSPEFPDFDRYLYEVQALSGTTVVQTWTAYHATIRRTPSPPTNLVAAFTDTGDVQVTWTEIPDNGSDLFHVEFRQRAAGRNWTAWERFSVPTDNQFTLDGSTTGRTLSESGDADWYDIQVRGFNISGAGGFSQTQVSKPVDVPASNRIDNTCMIWSGSVWCWGNNDAGQLGDGTTIERIQPTQVITTTGQPLSGVTAIAQAPNHICAIATGDVYCWGSNLNSQVGGSGHTLLAREVTTTNNATHITANSYHTCIIDDTGAVYCWGGTALDEIGDDDGSRAHLIGQTTAGSSTPTQINGITGATDIAAGVFHTCAITSTDTKCWGEGNLGQLGTTALTNQSATPVSVDAATVTFDEIVAGRFHTCGIDTSDNVHCWGSTEFSALGILNSGTPVITQNTPAQISGLTGVQSLYAGTDANCAVTATETHCWGLNNVAQLGGLARTVDDHILSTPVVIPELANPSDLVIGSLHACVQTATGSVTCYGDNESNYLGVDAQTQSVSEPTQIVGISGVSHLSGGADYQCALVTDGAEVQCWGQYEDRNLSNAHYLSTVFPQEVTFSDGSSLAGFLSGHSLSINDVTTSLTSNYSCAHWEFMTLPYLICWGSNASYQFHEANTSPTHAFFLSGANGSNLQELPTSDIGTGHGHVCGIYSASGEVYCWGTGDNHQIGDTSTIYAATHIEGIRGASRIAAAGDHTCAIAKQPEAPTTGTDETGYVYCWGDNFYGQLGSSVASTHIPQRVGTITTATELSVGLSHVCVLLSDNTVTCWGDNEFGQLGNSSATSPSGPVTVQTGGSGTPQLSGVEEITSGAFHTCARTDTNQVWCWGGNSRGQLGNGVTTDTSNVAVQVPDFSADTIGAGYGHTCATKTPTSPSTDNTVWCWGDNQGGQIAPISHQTVEATSPQPDLFAANGPDEIPLERPVFLQHLLPLVEGDTEVTYAIDPSLPSGLTLEGNMISGLLAPGEAINPSVVYVWTATESGATTPKVDEYEFSFRLLRNDTAPLFPPERMFLLVKDQAYTLDDESDTEIGPIFPVALLGNGVNTYTISNTTPPPGMMLVPGVEGGVLSKRLRTSPDGEVWSGPVAFTGTPTSAFDGRYQWTVTDGDAKSQSPDSREITIIITVEDNDSPTFADVATEFSFTATGENSLNQLLPEATGGNGNIFYEIRPVTPPTRESWMRFTTQAPQPIISGEPTRSGVIVFDLVARDEDGDEDTIRITLTITADPTTIPGLTASAGNGQVDLAWEAPEIVISPVASYDYRIRTSDGTDWGGMGEGWKDIPGSSATTTSFTIPNLTNGTEYTIELRAELEDGTFSEAARVSGTPQSAPGAPTGLRTYSATNFSRDSQYQMLLDWEPPTGGTSVDSYQIRYRRISEIDDPSTAVTGEDWIAEANYISTTGDIWGFGFELASNTRYEFQVRAINDTFGTSDWSVSEEENSLPPNLIEIRSGGYATEGSSGNGRITLDVDRWTGAESFRIRVDSSSSPEVNGLLAGRNTSQGTLIQDNPTGAFENYTSSYLNRFWGVDDDIVEGPELHTLNLVVQGSENFRSPHRIGNTQIEIRDNDNAVIGITSDTTAVSEGESFDISVEMDNQVAFDVTAPISITGAEEADYTVTPDRITFMADTTNRTATATVTIVNDDLIEGDQTLQIGIGTIETHANVASLISASTPIQVTVSDVIYFPENAGGTAEPHEFGMAETGTITGVSGVSNTGTETATLPAGLVAANFSASSGVLTYTGTPFDFEDLPSDLTGVDLTLDIDDGGTPTTLNSTLTFANVNEPGTVSLEPPAYNIVGTELTATLTDDDTPTTNLEWTWHRWNSDTSTWNLIATATTDTYITTTDDDDTELEARVSYHDSFEPTGEKQTASASTATQIRLAISGTAGNILNQDTDRTVTISAPVLAELPSDQVTGYQIQYMVDPGMGNLPDWSTATTTDYTTIPFEITGLSASTTYLMRVIPQAPFPDLVWSEAIRVSTSAPITGSIQVTGSTPISTSSGPNSADFEISANETDAVSVVVTLSNPRSVSETFDVTIAASGTNAAFFSATEDIGSGTAVDTTVTIAAGTDSATLSIPITDDTNVENEEAFTLFVAAQPSGTVAINEAADGVEVTITDTDTAVAQISSASPNGSEGQRIAFEIQLDETVDAEVSLAYSISGVDTTDWELEDPNQVSPLIIPAGAGTTDRTINLGFLISTDNVLEFDETFSINLGPITGDLSGRITIPTASFDHSQPISTRPPAGSASTTITGVSTLEIQEGTDGSVTPFRLDIEPPSGWTIARIFNITPASFASQLSIDTNRNIVYTGGELDREDLAAAMGNVIRFDITVTEDANPANTHDFSQVQIEIADTDDPGRVELSFGFSSNDHPAVTDTITATLIDQDGIGSSMELQNIVYRWERSDDLVTPIWTPIPGETGQTYTIDNLDVDKYLRGVVVSYTDSYGLKSTPVNSQPTGAVVNNTAPSFVSLPPQTVRVGDPSTIDLTVAFDDPDGFAGFTVSLSRDNVIDAQISNAGMLSITAPHNAPGTIPSTPNLGGPVVATITATDTQGASTTGEILILVVPVDHNIAWHQTDDDRYWALVGPASIKEGSRNTGVFHLLSHDGDPSSERYPSGYNTVNDPRVIGIVETTVTNVGTCEDQGDGTCWLVPEAPLGLTNHGAAQSVLNEFLRDEDGMLVLDPMGNPVRILPEDLDPIPAIYVGEQLDNTIGWGSIGYRTGTSVTSPQVGFSDGTRFGILASTCIAPGSVQVGFGISAHATDNTQYTLGIERDRAVPPGASIFDLPDTIETGVITEGFYFGDTVFTENMFLEPDCVSDVTTVEASGEDADFFNVSQTGTVSLARDTAFDFDNPADADGDNIYKLTLTLTNTVNTETTERHLFLVIDDDPIERISLPDRPRLAGLTPNVIRAEWDTPDVEEGIEVTGYKVEYQAVEHDPNDDLWTVVQENWQHNVIIITDDPPLVANTQYRVRVTPVFNADGQIGLLGNPSYRLRRTLADSARIHAPYFTQREITIDVPENSTSNVVFTQNFTDFLEEGNEPNFSPQFSGSDLNGTLIAGLISRVSGANRSVRFSPDVEGPYDHESQPQLRYRINVTDSRSSSGSGDTGIDDWAILIVNITDADDPLPAITGFAHTNQPGKVELSWDVPTYAGPALSYAIDFRVPGTSENFGTYEDINSVNPPEVFRVVGDRVHYDLAAFNDAVPSSNLPVQIRATSDEGDGPASRRLVTKPSDPSPSFTNTQPDFTVREDATQIGRLRYNTVTDATLTFEITSPANSPFQIDSEGNITVSTGMSLDYETATSHTLQIEISDGLGTGLFLANSPNSADDQTTITITVEDVPEIPPAVTGVIVDTDYIDRGFNTNALGVTWDHIESWNPSIALFMATLTDSTGNKQETRVRQDSPNIVGGLTQGETYTITIRARNAEGLGPESTPVTATVTNGVLGPPDEFTVLSLVGGFYASWEPTNRRSLDSTQVATRMRYRRTGTTAPYTLSDDLSVSGSTIITGLTNGITYDVVFSAVDDDDNESDFSDPVQVFVGNRAPDFDFDYDMDTTLYFSIPENQEGPYKLVQTDRFTRPLSDEVIITASDPDSGPLYDMNVQTAVESVSLLPYFGEDQPTITLTGEGSDNFELRTDGSIHLHSMVTLDREEARRYDLQLSLTDGHDDNGEIDDTPDVQIPLRVNVGNVPEEPEQPTLVFTPNPSDITQVTITIEEPESWANYGTSIDRHLRYMEGEPDESSPADIGDDINFSFSTPLPFCTDPEIWTLYGQFCGIAGSFPPTINGLTEGTTYRFWLGIDNGEEADSWYYYYTPQALTVSLPSQLPSPQNVSIENIGDSTLKMTWDEPIVEDLGWIESYTVSLSFEQDIGLLTPVTSTVEIPNILNPVVRISNLNNGIEYEATVVAVSARSEISDSASTAPVSASPGNRAPILTTTSRYMTIPENSSPGTPAWVSNSMGQAVDGLDRRLRAIDPDGNGIFFSISGADAAMFEIDEISGLLTLEDGQSLDFETDPTLNINIELSDHVNIEGVCDDPNTGGTCDKENADYDIDTSIPVEVLVTNVIEPLPSSPPDVTFTPDSTSPDTTVGVAFATANGYIGPQIGWHIRFQAANDDGSTPPATVTDVTSFCAATGWTDIGSCTTAATSPVSLTGLTSRTSYRIWIAADNQDEFNSWFFYYTPGSASPIVPQAPNNDTFSIDPPARNQDTELHIIPSSDVPLDIGFHVQWVQSPPYGEPDWYFNTQLSFAVDEITFNDLPTISNLQPNTEYRIRIRTFNDNGTSDWYYTSATTDPTPLTVSLSVAKTTVTEGGSIQYTATLNRPVVSADRGFLDTDVSVDLTFSGTTDLADIVREELTETITFAVGDLTRTITVMTNDDTEIESDETITATLSNPSSGGFPSLALATVTETAATTIVDNDFSLVTLSPRTPDPAAEGGMLTFTITLSREVPGTVTVPWMIDDATTTDFDTVSGMVTFMSTDTAKTVSINIKSDDAPEPEENFKLHLGTPMITGMTRTTPAAILGRETVATITITGHLMSSNQETSDTSTLKGSTPIGNTLGLSAKADLQTSHELSKLPSHVGLDLTLQIQELESHDILERQTDIQIQNKL